MSGGEKKLVLLVFLIVIFFLISPQNIQVKAAWWNNNWEYCRNITVSQGIDGYQYKIHITDTTHMDQNSIRVVNAPCNSGGTEVPHWTEKFETNDAIIWFKGSGTGTQYSIYYNNPSASDTSNGDNVFDYFDHWTSDNTGDWSYSYVGDPTNRHIWVYTNGQYTSSRELIIDYAQIKNLWWGDYDHSCIGWVNSTGARWDIHDHVCLRFEHDGGGYTPKVPDTNHVWVALETYKNGVRYVDTYKSFSIPSATDNLTFILRYTSSRIEFEVRNKDTNTLLTSDYNDSSSVIPSLSSVKYFFWGIWSYGGGWFTYQSPTYIRLGNNPTNGGMNMTVDYWFIKDYTSPEPTASVGSEESYSACKVLTDSITLNRDVSSSGTCYTIGASNIVIDCNGHTITYSQSSAGYGIKNTGGYDGITIKNCKIIQGSTNSNSHAIYISSTAASDDNVIVNNEIKTYGDNCWGINHYTNSNSFNNNISFNKITTNGANSGGIYNYFIESGANFNNNIINTTSTAIYSDTSCTNIKIKNNQLIVRVSGYAIGIIADSDNPVIENNTIESVSGGIRLSQLDNANVSNDKITLTGSSGCGINLYSTTNSQFQDGYVNSTNGATEYYVKTDGSNQFRNTDFTESRKIYFYDSNTWFVYNDKDTGG
ncbi:MAG: DUF2341 domain-containing protein, partial [Candidatus Aenigmarchaeota archaeon]|nr:DUF2341 domain-containing protein [Candidatus Aenigmarchaeota archaeon]